MYKLGWRTNVFRSSAQYCTLSFSSKYSIYPKEHSPCRLKSFIYWWTLGSGKSPSSWYMPLTATRTLDSKKKGGQQRRHRNSRTWSEVEMRSSFSEKMSYLQSADSYGLNVNVPVPVCPPPQQRRGVQTRRGERGVGGQYFGRREI